MSAGRARESEAANLACRVRGALRADVVDDGSRPGLRDFDLVFGTTAPEPLEVTSATLPKLRAAQAAYDKYDPLVMQIAGIREAWHVFSTQSTNFKSLTPMALLPLLVAAEATGLRQIHFPTDVHQAPFVYPIAKPLGIDALFVIGGRPGHVLVSGPNDDRMWTSDSVNPGRHVLDVIEELAAKADNRAKLGLGPAAGVESHLFVWIDEDNYLPWKDLVDGLMPVRPPSLPAEIITVWVATNVAGATVYWLYSSRTGWTT